MQKTRAIEFNFRDRESGVLRDGLHATRRVSTQGDFSELRAYALGDEVRSLDMRRSRFEFGDLVTRSYRESREFTLSIWIVLTPSFRFGTLEWTKLQILQRALELIGQDLLSAGHRGEVVIECAGHSELLSFSSVFEIKKVLTRLTELSHGVWTLEFATIMTTSPQTQPRPINNPNFATGPQERLELATWTPHILRLSRNPDSKIALFTTEPEHFQLRAELIQKHIDLHEFVIEHLEEQYQYEWCIGRILRALRSLKSPASYKLTQIFLQNGSTTHISHPTLLAQWLQQGFWYRQA